MTKRRALVLGLAALAIAAAAWLFWPSRLPPIGPASFEQIKEGMTLQEVEALIGLPPGDYCTEPLGDGRWSRAYAHPREEKGISLAEIPANWRMRSNKSREATAEWW